MDNFAPSALFLALTFGLVALIARAVKAGALSTGASPAQAHTLAVRSILPLIAWLTILAALASWGFFENFDTIPPRLFLALIPPLLLITYIVSRPFDSMVLFAIPISWPIFIQSFRIVMELILWLLFEHRVIPKQMTFEGLNIDIIVGLTAPFVGWMCLRPGRWKLRLARIWNLGALLILGNIVLIAIISTPSPLRFFMNEPANTIVGSFPFIWLPGFIVPVAVLAHFISLKQIRTLRQELGKK